MNTATQIKLVGANARRNCQNNLNTFTTYSTQSQIFLTLQRPLRESVAFLGHHVPHLEGSKGRLEKRKVPNSRDEKLSISEI